MTKRAVPPTNQELAEHVRALASTFKIKLVEDPTFDYVDGQAVRLVFNDEKGRRAPADTDLNGVVVRPVIDEASYAIALHELGHHCGTVDIAVQNKLDKELAAWEWAEYISLDWTVTMQQVKQHGLGTYYHQAAEQQARDAKEKIDSARRSQELRGFVKGLKL